MKLYMYIFIFLQLNKQMELCMAFINAGLLKHNIILGLDDRGKISCQKVNLCFIYFDSAECIVSMIYNSFLDSHSQNMKLYPGMSFIMNVYPILLEKTRIRAR